MWAEEWKDTPFWLDGLRPISVSYAFKKSKVGVLVIGSGYTGLQAALRIARAGKDVLVVDAGYPGFGCSTRNGGQLSTSIKPSYDKLVTKVGSERATEICREGEYALE